MDIRSLIPAAARRAWRNLKVLFTGDAEFLVRRLDYLDRDFRGLAASVQRATHPDLVAAPGAGLAAHEAKVYSQYGEDGILLHLFSKVGAPQKTFVEFGVNDGRECNTANLSLNFGWRGLLIEGDPTAFRRAAAFYASHLPGAARDRVRIVPGLALPENINRLLRDHGMTGEIGLLSIDIDSFDYWVWNAIDAASPRVVVMEYNGIFGPERAVTIPYDKNFDRFRAHRGGYYYGTSLAALVKLGTQKGYAFVGCETSGGVNAFFVRTDLAERAGLRALTAKEGYAPQARRTGARTQEELFKEIAHLPLAEV